MSAGSAITTSPTTWASRRSSTIRFLAAAERLAKACAASGKTAGTLDANPAFVRAQMARGYRMLGYATDVVATRSAYQAGFAALREG